MSDFAKILQQWERQQARSRRLSHESDSTSSRLEAVINRYPPQEEDLRDRESPVEQAPGSPALLPPEDELDLHGFTTEIARRRVRSFLFECKNRGLSKVLIVHGKGNHNQDGASKLKQVVTEELESNPIAGRTGTPPREQGGSGAVWVMIRQ